MKSALRILIKTEFYQPARAAGARTPVGFLLPRASKRVSWAAQNIHIDVLNADI